VEHAVEHAVEHEAPAIVRYDIVALILSVCARQLAHADARDDVKSTATQRRSRMRRFDDFFFPVSHRQTGLQRCGNPKSPAPALRLRLKVFGVPFDAHILRFTV